MLLTLIELSALGGGAIFMLQEYRNGFPNTQWIWRAGKKALYGVTGAEESEAEKAQHILGQYAKRLGVLREAVATVEADLAMEEKTLAEELELGRKARWLEEDALRKGKEVIAVAAAEEVVSYQEFTEARRENVEKLRETAEVLQRQLDEAEVEHSIVQHRANLISVFSNMAQANEARYALVSEVEATNGLTPMGELKKLMGDTEHAKIKSEKMLAHLERLDGKNGSLEVWAREESVRQELEYMRNKIALPPAGETEIVILSEEESR